MESKGPKATSQVSQATHVMKILSDYIISYSSIQSETRVAMEAPPTCHLNPKQYPMAPFPAVGWPRSPCLRSHAPAALACPFVKSRSPSKTRSYFLAPNLLRLLGIPPFQGIQRPSTPSLCHVQSEGSALAPLLSPVCSERRLIMPRLPTNKM